MSRNILGIDIRHHAVSAVLVKGGLKNTTIVAHEYVPLKDQEDLEAAVTRSMEIITEKLDLTDTVCVASYPADQLSFRNLQVPFKEKKKIRQMLAFELEPTLPLPVEDVIIDFHAVNSADHTDLIAAAIETEKLKSYLDTLAAFDIEPEIVTAGGFPAALCLANFAEMPENAVIVDTDNKKSTIFAVVDEKIELIRSFPIHSTGASWTESICTNIQRTLATFEDTLGLDFQPEMVLLTGNGLDDPNIAQNMSRHLEISVKQADLVRDIDIPLTNAVAQDWKAGLLDNALALALIEIKGINGFNFRRGPFAVKRHWEEHKKSLIQTGMIAALVVALIVFNIIFDSYALEKRLNELNSQITQIFKTTFPEVKTIVDPLQQMRIKIKDVQKSASFSGENGSNIRSIDILNHISRRIPNQTDVIFTRFVVGEDSVLISGNTNSFEAVDDMKNRLEQIEFFEKVTISSTNMDRGMNRVRFKLKVQL
jgi:type II secretion system protein L